MKKYLKIAGIISVLATSIASVAFAIDTGTFILDGGRDLGAVIPQSGNWFKPTVKYTDAEGVKKRMLDGLSYPGTFYTDRGVTSKMVDGTDPYFYIKWTSPAKINSLASVKTKLDGFYISWRKSGAINWTHVNDITEYYLAGYDDPSDSSIIVYPIINKLTKKAVAFMQYPCGNLICKDTGCLDLKASPSCGDGIVNPDLGEVCDPKDSKTGKNCTNICQWPKASCSLSVKETTFYPGSCISVGVTKTNSTILGYSGGTVSYTSSNCMKFDTVGKYSISATAQDTNTKNTFKCDPVTVNIVAKPVCGDSVVQSDLGEECDLGSSRNGQSGVGCTKSCSYEKPSCSVSVDDKGLSRGQGINSLISFKYVGTPYSLEFNGISKSVGSSLAADSCSNKIKYTVANPINGSLKVSCSDEFTATPAGYCGDGVVGPSEACDPADGKTGLFCTSSCALSVPTMCEIDLPATVIAGSTVTFGVTKDTKSDVVSASVSGKSVSVNGTRGSFSVSKAGTYIVSATVANPLDKSKKAAKSCEKTVVVKEKESC